MSLSKTITRSMATILVALSLASAGPNVVRAADAISGTSQVASKITNTQSIDAMNADLADYGRVSIIVEFDRDFTPDEIRNGILPASRSADTGDQSYSSADLVSETPQGAVQVEVASMQDSFIQSVSGGDPLAIEKMNISRMSNLPIIVLDATYDELAAISNDPNVRSIQYDESFPPNLAQSGPLIEVDKMVTAGATGSNAVVAVLDSGVDYTNGFNTVPAGVCFSRAGPDALSVCPNGLNEQFGGPAGEDCTGIDGCDHGTHVAGIAAGFGQLQYSSGAGTLTVNTSGVARSAGIFAYQVFRRRTTSATCGGGTPPCIRAATSDLIAALNDLLSRTDSTGRFFSNQGVIAGKIVGSANMSLGGGRFTGTCDTQSIKTAIDALAAKNVPVVIASGNSGYVDAVGYPACVSTAITVGNTTKSDLMYSGSTGSNQSNVVDMLAPGTNILSSVPGSTGTSDFKTGTSMAAPQVAGAFAALRQVFPNKTVAQIRTALINTGKLVPDQRTGGEVDNKRRIKVFEACKNLGGGVCATPPGRISVTPTSGFSTSVIFGGPNAVVSKNYVVKNTGGLSVNYTVTDNGYQGILVDGAATSVNGTLAAGASKTVKIETNVAVDSIPAGTTRNGTLSFNNTTNNLGNTTRTISITATANPGKLTVTPSTGFTASGFQGGPFTPLFKDYVLKNTGGQSLSFEVTDTIVGMVTDETDGKETGTLAPGASATVRIKLTGQNSLSAGTKTGNLVVKNLTNSLGNTTRALRINVNATAGAMTVTPSTSFFATGPEGGPFTPSFKNYVIKNTGGKNIDYAVSENLVGMDPTPESGTLTPGKSVTIKVVVNVGANDIKAGTSRSGTLTFTNKTNGVGNTTRALKVTATKATKEENDDIDDPAEITGASGTITLADNKNYTMETGERNHSSRVPGLNARSAWLSWKAPTSSQMMFDSAGSGAGDTVIAVYVPRSATTTPTVKTITQIASNDNDAGGLDGRIFFNAVKGKVYLIAVAALNDSVKTGSYKLNWSTRTGATAGLVASVLPSARAVKNGEPATAFATIVNSSNIVAKNCTIALPPTGLGNSLFQFRTASPANQLTREANQPVDIPAGGTQNFVFGITPDTTITSSEVELVFDCENMKPVTTFVGLNTLGLSSSTTAPADMVAVAQTIGNTGVVDLPGNSGSSFFVAAVVNNNGPNSSITASVDTGSKTLPVSFTLCRSNPATGACLSPASSTVTWTATTNTPYTFSIFVKGRGNVAFDPANNRAFLKFKQGSTTRGGSSVAVRTVAP